MTPQCQPFSTNRKIKPPSYTSKMRKPNHPAWNLFIVTLLLLLTRSTNADSLLVTSGQTMQLGLPGISTNYSFTSVTVDTGGTLKIAGSVTLTVSSNVLINGQMIGGSTTTLPSGMDGGDGADGTVIGNVATDGDPGDDAANGTNAFADVPNLSILAKNMIVNGSILFNPQANAGDGGDGGAAGKGADGLSPTPSQVGGAAGFGGPGGVGGNGGQSLGSPNLSIEVGAFGGSLPSAGNFILGSNGVISLDNMGGGGGGGGGGDGGDAGKGGDGANGLPGGAGGNGGPPGFGGAGGTGGQGGFLSLRALGIDLEGTISLMAGDGGDGGDFGTPKDGGNGGNGGLTSDGSLGGRGGNGGDASAAFLLENPGGGGGNGGFGGNFIVSVSVAFTNFAKLDFSGGKGGKGGSGQPGETGMGGTGGTGGSGAASGLDGQPSADVPDGPPGIDGPAGSMSVMNPNWGTNFPNGWQTFGNGVLTFGFTNNIHTLILSSTKGPFSVAGQLSDPRLQFDSGADESIVETNVPVELQFAYQWLTTTGSVDVLLGGRVVLHLNAPSVLSSSLTEATIILTGLPAAPTDQLNLTFQLNTVGPAQFQLGEFSLQSLPQLPALTVASSPTNSTALTLSWFGTTNGNYQVQSRTSLVSGSWTNLGSVIPGQGTVSTVALPATPGDPTRFYRLIMTPAN
jgi:hypothetical protein